MTHAVPPADPVAAAASLARSLAARGFEGYDPYDGLASTVTPFLRHARLRQVWVQLHKRSPLNLRPLFGIRPRVMTKTLALASMAAVRSVVVRHALGPAADALPRMILARAERDGDRAWWSYEFPVQTRWSSYAAGTPNAIVTAFAGRALFEAGAADEELLRSIGTQLVTMAARGPKGAFFRYVPDSTSQVHNASALSAALLADLALRLGRDDWLELAMDAGRTLVRAQRPAGGWPYGEERGLGWEDGFHTAYVLLALRSLQTAGLEEAGRGLRRGFGSFMETFFVPSGGLRYDARARAIPEAHNAGTCLQAVAELSALDPRAPWAADALAEWAIDQLWLPSAGRFAYRKGSVVRNRIAYPRWSDGHMLLGLASHLRSREEAASTLAPVEDSDQ